MFYLEVKKDKENLDKFEEQVRGLESELSRAVAAKEKAKEKEEEKEKQVQGLFFSFFSSSSVLNLFTSKDLETLNQDLHNLVGYDLELKAHPQRLPALERIRQFLEVVRSASTIEVVRTWFPKLSADERGEPLQVEGSEEDVEGVRQVFVLMNSVGDNCLLCGVAPRNYRSRRRRIQQAEVLEGRRCRYHPGQPCR